MSDKNLFDQEDYLKARVDEYIWQKSKDAGISRQRFLQILATMVGATAIGELARPAPAHSGAMSNVTSGFKPKNSNIRKPPPPGYISHSKGTLEMNWEAMYKRGYIVPNDWFYVHNRNAPPPFDPSTWRLRIEGTGVSAPREFTYDEIVTMPSISVTCAIECAANGRRFFEDAYNTPLSGTRWRLGAIGVAEWTGVPLSILFERVGLKSTARDVLVEGADLDSLDSKGTKKSKFSSVVPITKALADNSLLVYAMNGEPLPPDHGQPCRVLFPGWAGNANVKWIERIEVSQTPIYTQWVMEQMVLTGADYPAISPYKGKLITYQNVKSAFELAWPATLSAGNYLLRGRSWSGKGKIVQVEVSLDGGKTWQFARLREPNFPFAWVRWDIEWDVVPGEYFIQARATDNLGNTQPSISPWNDFGLLYGGVVSHPVKVQG
ncbi:sulfite oxidase-like oxidoreductase [Cylindrospermum stagnale PCC 7417]|uniref:Sulfite oxidase-like oxidoreductase n=1 Tax=Cylindrospermum stagnale PCC 7417 TaxID=56107 RepID=K9X2E8_9NOST|nr:sulfite oxidase [Cylindrospermum stagnale]AFZ25907.1 sulfite oxidase-like oxidoreductase [Cylindrospermum stagnale PCC 7417]